MKVVFNYAIKVKHELNTSSCIMSQFIVILLFMTLWRYRYDQF